ncbi:MAG TPA: hypothetical protein VFB63_35095 [Bryobacteraceae bacterium]|nr:hypothetical protein [Bryobacteraceae bacterium]
MAEKRLGESLPEFGILLTALMPPLHSTLLEPSRLPAFVDSIVKVRLKRPTTSILRI